MGGRPRQRSWPVPNTVAQLNWVFDIDGEVAAASLQADYLLPSGAFELSDGTIHQSPPLAAMRSANVVAYDGWLAWRLPRLGGTS